MGYASQLIRMDQSCAVAKAGEKIAAKVLILFVRLNYTSTILFLQFGRSKKQMRGVYGSQHEARGSDESIFGSFLLRH